MDINEALLSKTFSRVRDFSGCNDVGDGFTTLERSSSASTWDGNELMTPSFSEFDGEFVAFCDSNDELDFERCDRKKDELPLLIEWSYNGRWMIECKWVR